MPTRYGLFRIVAFGCPENGSEHVVLIKGRVSGMRKVLVRVHSECLTGDVFGSLRCDCGGQLEAAMRRISKEDRGVLLYLAQEGRGIGLANKVAAYHLQDHGLDTIAANQALGLPVDARDYKCAACMIKILGIKSLRLMTNNPEKIEELRTYGISVDERVPLEVEANPINRKYLRVKKDKLRHLLSSIR